MVLGREITAINLYVFAMLNRNKATLYIRELFILPGRQPCRHDGRSESVYVGSIALTINVNNGKF
jgi:hypothetical protein